MNKNEAQYILRSQLQNYKDSAFSELKNLIDALPITFDVNGQSKAIYQIEIQAYWDDLPNGNIRVVGSIADKGWRAFLPLTESFIKTPQNSLIG